ncbi:MoxR family ATPase [Salinicoccus cyprini]|uniref:MoxR family ATPase n=1 Tax=Salinicoccus cyprini TaxID=2493691 RepID=A0A558AZ77_9STAP|nr:MoxR family ATPase [Salinicoccus cyprini]TVT29588.1 MoxR family ATPase [Salinicoccus cyprini]
MAIQFFHNDETIRGDAMIILSLGKNLLLKGPTGAGKTRLAEDMSRELDQPIHSINCSVDVDIESLLGFKTIEYMEGRQEITFIDGPVIRAMKEGAILYIDEINMARPEVLPILNAALDYRRTITNPLTGDVITAEQGFRVIAAINVGYVGTMPMNEALLNRFNVIELGYVSKEALAEILKTQSIQKDESIIDEIAQFHSDLVTMTEQGQISQEASSVRSLIDLADLSTKMPISRACYRAIIDKLDSEQEKKAILNATELQFGMG